MARHKTAQAPRLASQFRVFFAGSFVNIDVGSRNIRTVSDHFDATYTENSVARRLSPRVVPNSVGLSGVIDLKSNGAYQVQVTGTFADWNGVGTNDWYLYSLVDAAPVTIDGVSYQAYTIESAYLEFATTTTVTSGTFAYDEQVYLQGGAYAVGFDMVAGTSQENTGFDLTITITPVET